MRRALGLLVTVWVLTPPALAAPLGRVPAEDGQPLVLEVALPTNGGMMASYLIPGGAQFYLGDPARGWLYTATALAAAGLIAYLPTTQTSGFFASPEQIAFTLVQGVGLSWLTLGTVSLVDGMMAMGSMRPVLETVAEPTPHPTRSPRR